MICQKCESSTFIYQCQEHRVYVCYECLVGVRREAGSNVEGTEQTRFSFKCLKEDCNFNKVSFTHSNVNYAR